MKTYKIDPNRHYCNNNPSMEYQYCELSDRYYESRPGDADCPFCTVDNLQEQLKTTRLEAARQAYALSRDIVKVVRDNETSEHITYASEENARIRFFNTFGEYPPND